MLINLVFEFCSNYLIEFMGALLIVGLGFRMASWRSSRANDAYFSSFASEVEKTLSQSFQEGRTEPEIETYLEELLESVRNKLPSRMIRSKRKEKKNEEVATRVGARNVVSLREYVHGEGSLFHSVKQESGTFKGKYPPNYNDLTDRILEKDLKWNRLLKIFPIAPIARLNDVLPAIFVVLGIFGTFIGISMALPEIAKIDFNNIDGSGEILSRFVLSVTYAMKTSIAGILFSLVMTFLNTLAPVTGIRKKTYKKLASCMENIWLAYHHKKATRKDFAEILPELLEEFRMLRKELVQVPNQERKGA